jgi:gamma-glutamylputrescine oxidase
MGFQLKRSKRKSFFRQQWDQQFTKDVNYYQVTLEEHHSFNHLVGEQVCDFCIIGAGFTGLSAAYFLKNSSFKTVMLERHEAGWGASGRNGGQILPGYTAEIEWIKKKYGDSEAKTLWNLSIEGMDIVKSIILKEGIECDLKEGAIYSAADENYKGALTEHLSYLENKLEYRASLKDKEELSELLGTDHYKAGMYMKDAAHFHPLKYIKGLSASLNESENIKLYEHSPASAVVPVEGGYEIHTPTGLVKTKKIILCGDSYLGNLVPELRNKYVLLRNAVIATEPLTEEHNVMPSDKAVCELSTFMHFFRKGADGSFLFGGGDAVKPKLSVMRTQKNMAASLKENMLKIYPSLKDAEIIYDWGGYISMTSTFLPNVGKLLEGVYYANGYSGHGVNNAHVTGRMLADAVLEKNDHYKVFENIKNKSFPGKGYWDNHIVSAGILMHLIKERITQ